MNENQKNVKDQDIKEFLLAEYETLHSMREALISMGENRLNFFLAFL